MSDQPRKVLVSACLLGRDCRYDGGHNRDDLLEREFRDQGLTPVPFCPEEHGGLSTPRPAAWIERGSADEVLDGTVRLVTAGGEDVTKQFLQGAEGALELCQSQQITHAFLKERSPSCGVCTTHVNGVPAPGPGVTAALLQQNGIQCTGVQGKRNP